MKTPAPRLTIEFFPNAHVRHFFHRVATPVLSPEHPPRFIIQWNIGFYAGRCQLWQVCISQIEPFWARRRRVFSFPALPEYVVGAVYFFAALALLVRA